VRRKTFERIFALAWEIIAAEGEKNTHSTFVKKYPSPSEHLKHGHTLSTHTFNMFAKPLEVIFHVFSARLGP
jgi:hypothetical protein